jgi:hypothetical protein
MRPCWPFEPGAASHEGTSYDIPTDGRTRLAVDANRRGLVASGPPRFFLWTEGRAATIAHLRGPGVTITSEVEDIGSVSPSCSSRILMAVPSRSDSAPDVARES